MKQNREADTSMIIYPVNPVYPVKKCTPVNFLEFLSKHLSKQEI